jgi:hypothetical protein
MRVRLACGCLTFSASDRGSGMRLYLAASVHQNTAGNLKYFNYAKTVLGL